MSLTDGPTTLSFDAFWNWLMMHPNCILRAGTPDAVVYDDDDFHWHFAADGPNFYVQVIRGKRLMGELVVASESVTYVEMIDSDREGETNFDLIVESEQERIGAYFFVMSHGFEEEELPGHDRAVH